MVWFASRYPPSDIACIFRTMSILDKLTQRSFAQYIFMAIGEENSREVPSRRVAAALHFLTYAEFKQINSKSLPSKLEEIQKRSEGILKDGLDYQELCDDFEKNSHDKKRLWCSLRDYLKSPEFNQPFVTMMKAKGLKNYELWRQGSYSLRQALSALELPGDVWNNNDTFREGLFDSNLQNVPENWDVPRLARAVFNEYERLGKSLNFYPEQLDVSFDFVPRMCAQNLCDICFLGGGVERMCHQKAGILCTCLLVACGYRNECVPSECRFRNGEAKGSCGVYKAQQSI